VKNTDKAEIRETLLTLLQITVRDINVNICKCVNDLT